MIAGLVGSIDNDMVGTDMTIGADSALHRIVEAIDAVGSTAASHQRSFVIEVMGRHCGYLALMSAIAGGADYVADPGEPARAGLGGRTCASCCAPAVRPVAATASWSSPRGRIDTEGNPITSNHVRSVLEERLNEDTRVTILGHVQRGGSPSAYDRSMPSILGYHAVEEVLCGDAGEHPAAHRHPLQPGVEVAAGGLRGADP